MEQLETVIFSSMKLNDILKTGWLWIRHDNSLQTFDKHNNFLVFTYTNTTSTCYDATSQARNPFNLAEIVWGKIFVTGGVQFWAITEMFPNAGGLYQRKTKGGVNGRAHGDVF